MLKNDDFVIATIQLDDIATNSVGIIKGAKWQFGNGAIYRCK